MTTEKVLEEGSVNRYDFIKNAYQQRREYLVYDGNPPGNDVDADEDDRAAPLNSSSTAPVGNKTNSLPATAPPSTNNTGLPPVNDNSKHFLELSAPEEKK
jgi:phospholipid-binding lipoprotein MlaA